MQLVRILYQDSALVVVEKPAGYQVHTPESMSREGRALLKNNLMKIVRNQIGQKVYPVHRIDRATSGVLIFALSSAAAAKLQLEFKEHRVRKTYFALVRGWTKDKDILNFPLTTRLDGGKEVQASTPYSTLFRFELPVQTQSKHESSRYSLVEVHPLTGRLHQIRRHFRKISHPLIGDTVHGDGKHNRVWREFLPGAGLFLKAYSIEFSHPESGEKIYVRARWNKHWHALFDRCGFCPLIY